MPHINGPEISTANKETLYHLRRAEAAWSCWALNCPMHQRPRCRGWKQGGEWGQQAVWVACWRERGERAGGPRGGGMRGSGREETHEVPAGLLLVILEQWFSTGVPPLPPEELLSLVEPYLWACSTWVKSWKARFCLCVVEMASWAGQTACTKAGPAETSAGHSRRFCALSLCFDALG